MTILWRNSLSITGETLEKLTLICFLRKQIVKLSILTSWHVAKSCVCWHIDNKNNERARTSALIVKNIFSNRRCSLMFTCCPNHLANLSFIPNLIYHDFCLFKPQSDECVFVIFLLSIFVVVQTEIIAFWYIFFSLWKTYFTLTVCGSAVNNSLKSPGYPVTDYQSNMDCIYLVPIPRDMAMNISFKDFVTEDGLLGCEWVTLLCKLLIRIHLTWEVTETRCWFSSLLRGFSPGSPVFLPPQKLTLLNSKSI